jgi:hypothetical protein
VIWHRAYRKSKPPFSSRAAVSLGQETENRAVKAPRSRGFVGRCVDYEKVAKDIGLKIE